MRIHNLFSAVTTLAVVTSCTIGNETSAAAFTPSRLELRASALGCWTLVDANVQQVAGRSDWIPPVLRLDSAVVYRGAEGVNRLLVRLDTTGHELPRFLEQGINGSNEWAADARGAVLALRIPCPRIANAV